MQLLLVVIFVLGTWYLTSRRRYVDAFTVAFFAAALYFLPGFVGYTLSPVTPASPVKLPMPMVREALAIMSFVLGSIVVGAMARDAVAIRGGTQRWRLEDASLAAEFALVLGALGVLLTWAESGGAAFAPDKRTVIAVVGRGHLVWEMGAIFAATFAVAYRKRWVFVGALALLALDMFIGFRFAFAIAFIACAWLWVGGATPRRLRDVPRKFVLMVLAGGLLIISFQNLKEPIRNGDWAEIGNRMSNPVWYFQSIMTSEPFTTQTILNEVVRNDFRTATDHLWSASHHLIMFAPALGAEAARFNDQYQVALFPSVDHGLANNIWAQMWSAGGWPLLVGFTLIYILVLAGGSSAVRSGDPAVRALAVVFMAFWAFYIHRNELLTQVGYQKQVLLTWAACVVAAIVVAAVARRTSQVRNPRHAT